MAARSSSFLWYCFVFLISLFSKKTDAEVHCVCYGVPDPTQSPQFNSTRGWVHVIWANGDGTKPCSSLERASQNPSQKTIYPDYWRCYVGGGGSSGGIDCQTVSPILSYKFCTSGAAISDAPGLPVQNDTTSPSSIP